MFYGGFVHSALRRYVPNDYQGIDAKRTSQRAGLRQYALHSSPHSFSTITIALLVRAVS